MLQAASLPIFMVGALLGAADTKLPRHPVVAGFERLHQGDEHLAAGGQLLLGELNCIACHAPGSAWQSRIVPKAAPILSDVGSRVKVSWLRAFLSDPRHTKPGTTMPDVLARLAPEQRTEHVEALVHYLASTAEKLPIDQAPNRTSAKQGETLFHQVGCVACHGPRTAKAPTLNTSIPLGDVAAKYSIGTLAKFLRDPLAARPSGRMPSLALSEQESRDLAHYFLRDVGGSPPNLRYAYYEGKFEKLRDLDVKRDKKNGECLGFDLTVATKLTNMALRFQGFLRIATAGEYTFHLTSDDGSRLMIDGEKVVENDGIHPQTTKTAAVALDRGMHEVEVLYFNAEADAFLDLEYESDDIGRIDLASAISLTEEAKPPRLAAELKLDDRLVERGRGLFASLGCAACHSLREAGATADVASTLKAPKLSALAIDRGCLDKAPRAAPNYALAVAQRKALAAALETRKEASVGKADPKGMIPQYLTAMNCIACHQRDGLGGVEPERNDYFASTIKEMGDEGRLPPPLTGVGGKVRMGWLRDLLGKGVKDRPYMLTRMPVFGLTNTKPLIEALVAADKLPPLGLAEFSEPLYRVKDQGRFLIGSKAFSCIKCHTFGQYKAEGIQSIDMATMTRRLERDWFLRYIRDPLAFRPGTRMPAAWPKTGKSYLPTVFEGDADKQIAAVWTYLLDGTKAPPPVGIGGEPIDLVATTEPIVYRGFLEGVGPRGIAVGFPEGVDYAFDADALRLAMIWKGGLIDASKHWGGRGGGFQPPLGHHVTPLPEGRAIVRLASSSAPWPEDAGRAPGYQFLGYQFDPKRAPTLDYRILGIDVIDAIMPVVSDSETQLERTMTLDAKKPLDGLWLRAAVGERIDSQADDWYTIDRTWRVRLQGGGAGVVRTSGGRQELIVPLVFHSDGGAVIRETFQW